MLKRLLAPLAVLVLVLAGCSDDSGGDDDDASPTTEAPTEEAMPLDDWVEEADAICADFDEQIDAMGEPESEEEFAEFLGTAEGYFTDQLEALEALGTPDEMGEEVEQALDLLGQQADLVAEAREAAEDGDIEGALTVMEQGEELSAEADSLADEIGLEVCGGDGAEDEPVDDTVVEEEVPDESGSDEEASDEGSSDGGADDGGGAAAVPGDDAALDALWEECADGNGAACDELYWTSPSGSDYETFGNTCGGRFSEDEVPFSCEDEIGGDKVDTGSDEAVSYGDDPVFDALWDECDGGDLAACDELFWTSPVDSEYEAFGNTCGGRYDESEVPLSCEEGE